MNIQGQYERAIKAQDAARASIRHGGNDMHIDHWAMRLTFWKDEAKRLRRIAEADGCALSDQED